jgi:hypothetical protein
MKILLLLLLSLGLAHAQVAEPKASATPESTPLQGFWRAILPGGIFRVRLDRIQSVSTHEYGIEPLTRVTELTVETGGSLATRFYYQEIVTPQAPLGIGQSAIDLVKEKTEEAAGKIVGDTGLWKKVTKIYPATTHAHTVEYRLTSKADVQLLESVERAWSTGRGEEIKLN